MNNKITRALSSDIGDFRLLSDDCLYTIQPYPTQSFVYSLFRVLLPRYLLIEFHIQIEHNIDCFFEHLLVSYDSNDLYKKYKYAHMVPKRALHTDIVERRVSRNLIQLICDFCQINIVIN
jgi:hypothetical protein